MRSIQHKFIRIQVLAVLLIMLGVCSASLPQPDFMPLGVYLSWERVHSHASNYEIDYWEDLDRRLDALEANNVNMLWVTNLGVGDLPGVIEACAAHDMKLVVSMVEVELKVDWRWANDGAYYDSLIPTLVAAADGSDTLVGWVLSDEPSVQHMSKLEALREKFLEYDPDRFCLTVTMPAPTFQVPRQTNLPVVCTDLYPFFGPNDINGPHTDPASRVYYRENLEKMMDAIGQRPIHPWVMGMCFSEIFGPWRYDEDNWHTIGLPGSYCHWRAPTMAEIRWQVWEGIRSGCRGVIIYTLAGAPSNPDTAELPARSEAGWQDMLVQEPTDMGVNALTNPDASSTAELETLGQVYRQLEPHCSLILRWQAVSPFWSDLPCPLRGAAFVDYDEGHTYMVLVNDDFHSAVEQAVRFPSQVTAVTDIMTGAEVNLEDDFSCGSKAALVHLEPGQGTVWRVVGAPLD